MPVGVYPRPSLEERFWNKVNKNGPVPAARPDLGPCWIWTAHLARYGTFSLNYKTVLPHRVSFEMSNGPIPEGLVIDHLCKRQSCVRPSHMEAVTPYVNLMRSDSPPSLNARKTHCQRGHPYDSINTLLSNGKRFCRICHNAHTRKWKQRTGYQRIYRERRKAGEL